MFLLLALTIGWNTYSPINDFKFMYCDSYTDCQNHLPKNHVYNDSDIITSVHECTHGINSLLRQKKGKPCFYTLNDKFFQFSQELPGTLSEVAKRIPENLRGDIYQLYCVDSQRWWNAYPSYLFDELTAYINGSVARQELKRVDRKETLAYACELVVYCFYLNHTNESRQFLKYQTAKLQVLVNKNDLHLIPPVDAIFKAILQW